LRFEISKKKMKQMLDPIGKVTSALSVLPILKNTLIQCEDDKLTMFATDLEVAIKKTVQCNVIETGELTVPARKLLEIVKSLPSDAVIYCSVEKDTQTMEIVSGDAKFQILGLSGEEFPQFPTVESEPVEIDLEALLAGLASVSFCAATDESRYFLNGVYFDCEDGRLVLTATDSRRLGLCETDIELSTDGVIVPNLACKAMQTAFADGGTGKIVIEETQLKLSNADTTLTTRLIEGEYPRYRDVIPTGNEIEYTLSTDEFLQVLKRMSPMENPKTKMVRLGFVDGVLTMQAETPQMGSAIEKITISNTANFKTAFDGSYLQEAAIHIPTSEMLMTFDGTPTSPGSPLAPCLLKPVGDAGLMFLCMPMRID